MSTTCRRIWAFGIILLIGGLWIGAGRAVAAGDAVKLPPIPEVSPAATPPPAKGQTQGTPFHEESSSEAAAPEDQCDEFCDLPMCGPPGRIWLRADYVLWWTNGTHLPPLVTTSTQGTPSAQAGVLGNPNTTILYGGQTISNDGRSGFQTTIGLWVDPSHLSDVEFDYLNLGERANRFYQNSQTGDPILARPFFNVQTNLQDRALVAYANQPGQPNLATGSIAVDSKDYFQSAGVLVSHNLCSGNSDCGYCDSCDSECATACAAPLLYCRRADVLFGFRYYNLSDRVAIAESVRDLSAAAIPTFDIEDSFRARNDFYGGEVGLRTQAYRGRWSLQLLTKVAVGDTRTTVNIDGQTSVTPLTGPTAPAISGGLLALASPPGNIGRYQHDVFTMVPQLGVELGYQVSCRLRAYAGYNLLYWSSVSRAADQINQVNLYVDPRNVPSSTVFNPAAALPFPTFPDKTAAFWAQGVNVGTELRF